MEEQNNNEEKQTGISGEQVKNIQMQLSILKTFKNGADAFYWITGLSIINSLIFYFGGNTQFVIGLGIAQLSDVIIKDITQRTSLFQLFASILLSGIYVICGYYAHKKYKNAFLIGIILYLIDAFLFLLFQDFLSMAFHGIILYEAFKGYKACKEILKWNIDQEK